MAAASAAVHRRVLGSPQHASWPPPPDAVTPAGAQAAAEAFGARDAPLHFAWSTAAEIEPWAEGTEFFPRILADVEAARASIHILMFGWREGEVGMQLAGLLERKLAAGVEVRAIVDGFGSKPHKQARAAVAWTGGAGIEDHFRNGEFHDVMVRVTGDVVRQAQAAFLASFRARGGPLPADLSPHFPAPADPGAVPVALAQVLPGGFVAWRRRASRSGSSRAPSSTPRSWWPTTSSASAPSTSTPGRCTATPRS